MACRRMGGSRRQTERQCSNSAGGDDGTWEYSRSQRVSLPTHVQRYASKLEFAVLRCGGRAASLTDVAEVILPKTSALKPASRLRTQTFKPTDERFVLKSEKGRKKQMIRVMAF